MSAQCLMTVPHAEITMRNYRTGEIDHPDMGSYVNVRGASIATEGKTLIVQLANGCTEWRFECATTDIARKYATTFSIRGQR